MKQSENKKLETEFARVNKLLVGSHGEKEIVKSLKLEIDRQKHLIETRDKKVSELMESEKVGREHKNQIIKDLESIKGERDQNAGEIKKIQSKMVE